MKPIKSLMCRRQFLIAAGMTSTAALAGSKISGALNPSSSMASELPTAVDLKGAFKNKYSHLLSPVKFGDVLVKNRLMQADSYPFFMQGPEYFPSEQVLSWYSNVAKNGCAIVMVFKGDDPPVGNQAAAGGGTHGWIPVWDKSDVKVQSYFGQLTDAIHFYGSKAAVCIAPDIDKEYSISKVVLPNPFARTNSQSQAKEIPAELLQESIKGVVKQAEFYKGLGFDMVHFHMSYRRSILANALSPVLNKRTDTYGGNLENRARFHLEMFQAIKKVCGPNFLVGAHLSGKEMGEGGYTPQDVAEYAKIWQDALDILVVRGESDNISHASPYTFSNDNNPILAYSHIIKKSGARLAVVPNGGFQDLARNNEYIASGKADMISMARAWWADPEYGKKAYEGRSEDVVPCVRCNDCHGKVTGVEGPPVSFCTVNPEFGLAHRINRMIDAPVVSRKVAVIGGGPAGMKAAITAAERGHRVTLYEKNDYLGGQLKHTDYPSFKWSYRDFKDYLVRQVKKSGIEVHLSSNATPEMIRSKGYDVVIAALGAEPVIPEIPGAGAVNVLAPIFAYNNKSLGKNIVVIGGEQIGTETGMYLAERGHNVTVLTADKKLAPDANFIHLSSERWETDRFKTFSFITEATVKNISESKVTYVDSKGSENFLQFDNVVVYAGRKPRQAEALKFFGAAERFFVIGDCNGNGNIVRISDGNLRTSLRTAYGAASQI